MAAARCPICRKPTESENNSDFPFCGERCRLLDLGNWASEKYRVSLPDEAGQPVFDESEFGVPSAPISRTGEAEEAEQRGSQRDRDDRGSDDRQGHRR